MIVNRVDAAARAGWDTPDAPTSRGHAAPRSEGVQAPVDPIDTGERCDDAASRAQEPTRERAILHAAQTVAQLESLVARNPDLAAELGDGLIAARAKLDQTTVDRVASRLDAGGAGSVRYADYAARALRIGAELAARSAGDPVALAAIGRALNALRAPDYLQEQLDIARVDLSAYAILQSARGRPVDAGVVAGKETSIARLEALVAGAQAASPRDTDTNPDTHRGRLGIDPTDASQ